MRTLTSALDRVVVNATSRPPYTWGIAGIHCIGGWVGPSDDLDECGKSHLYRNSIPRTVQPVASRYTDCAIPAHSSALQVRSTIFCPYLCKTTQQMCPWIELDAGFSDVSLPHICSFSKGI